MPTIITHALFAAALGAAYRSGPLPLRFWVLAAACALLPDIDVVAFVLGVPYSSVWGHRGVTHSIAFAVLTGAAAATLARHASRPRRFWSLAAFFCAATLSHSALDMLTNGGLGVALFAPFSAERYFAPWRPVLVSPIGGAFFSRRGARVLGSEVVWVWIPAAALLLVGWLRSRRPRAAASTS